jgi:GNAT superfamily N-acetyltransferase
MIREIEPGEGHLVAAVLHELRTHLDPADIPGLVDAQRPGGYRVVAAFADAPDRHGGEAVAAAGFRTATNLSLGHHLYVDDLVTLPTARRGGHARALLEWLAAEGRRQGCAHIHLDSATHRHPAHRLYLGAGYDIAAFHFGQAL